MLLRSDIRKLLEDLYFRSPELLPPLPIPRITPVEPFSAYGNTTVLHLKQYYKPFYEYLEHHEQVYDFIFPIQQELRYCASLLTEKLIASQSFPSSLADSPDETEVLMWSSLPQANPEPEFAYRHSSAEAVKNMTLRKYLYPTFPLPIDEDECPF